MNPIPEELGQTARSVVDVFKASPMVAALLIFNIAYMVMIAWMTHQGATRWSLLSEKLISQCGPQGG